MDRTDRTENAHRTGVLYILLSSTGYAFVPIFSKNLSGGGLGPLDIAVFRYLLAAPLFWLLVMALRTPRGDKPLPRPLLLGMGIFWVTAALTAFAGLQYVPAGIYTVLFYTYPAMVALISAVRGERLDRVGWLALALTLIGVSLTVGDLSGLQGGTALLGVALSLVNAAIIAVYFLVSSALLRGYSDVGRVAAYTVTGAMIILLGLAALRGITVPTSGSLWLLIVGLAVFSTVLPIFSVNAGIRRLGAPRAAILSTVEPVLAILAAWALLGEMLRPVQWLGGGLILASVLLFELRRQKPASV